MLSAVPAKRTLELLVYNAICTKHSAIPSSLIRELSATQGIWEPISLPYRDHCLYLLLRLDD